MNTKFKIEFAPGCFDNFEGSQEELDNLVFEIKQMIQDGTFFEKAQLVEDVHIDEERSLENRKQRLN